MQSGIMYNDLDLELMRACQKTMALTTAYDQSPAKHEALLAKILGTLGDDTVIGSSSVVIHDVFARI